MLDHREANESVIKFIIELLRCGMSKEVTEDSDLKRQMVHAVTAEHGQTLVTNLLNACLYCLPSYMLLDSADLLYELMLFDRASVCQWLEVTLKQLPTQSSGGAVTATHQQLLDFHKEVTSASTEKAVKSALHEFIRLYR
jgi:transportin-3